MPYKHGVYANETATAEQFSDWFEAVYIVGATGATGATGETS